MRAYPEPDELENWLVWALRRRGALREALRLRVTKLPDEQLPWRPLEGAKSWNVDRLLRYELEMAIRPAGDPDHARERLLELRASVQAALDDEDILGGRYPEGYADGRPEVEKSEDGRFLTSKLKVSLVAPA